VITRLTGTLVECELTEAVVDVHGVGFAVSVPMSTYDQLPSPGSEVQLLTHFSVREDAMQLYGFSTPQERQLFRMLLTVSGVGPKLALNVLSCMSVSTFCQTIVMGDVKALSRINGIGKRSAERLTVELRDRVPEIEPAAGFRKPEGETPSDREIQDAVAALSTLGFKTDVARKAVQKISADLPKTKQTAEVLIRRALTALNS
jgi:holliday junction DNA helicase RuvA